MKLDCILTSCNLNTNYLDFVPYSLKHGVNYILMLILKLF